MRLKQFVKKYIDPNLIVNVFVKVNNKYYKKVYSCLRAKNLLIDLEHDNYKNYSVLKIEEIKQNRYIRKFLFKSRRDGKTLQIY